MSKKSLLHSTVRRRYLYLMALFSFLLLSVHIQGQAVDYPSGYLDGGGNPILLGTSDSRFVATIVETDNTVTFKVIAVGEFRADGLEFNIFFKESALSLTNSTFTADLSTVIGNSDANPSLLNAVEFSPDLVSKGWYKGVVYQKQTGSSGNNYSYRTDMRALVTRVGKSTSTPTTIVEALSGEIKPTYEFYFNKVTPGAALLSSDIGFGVKTTSVGGRFTPKWTYSQSLSYANDGSSGGETTIVPNLFAFRSPSSIYTDSVKTTSSTSATLYGTFKRGDMTPNNNVIDNVGSATTGSARLDWDSITQSAFIYSTSNVSISIPEYTYTMIIDGVTYASPSAAEVAAGTFTRGTHTFYVQTSTLTSANNTSQSVGYNVSLSRLPANSTFYAWSFMNYVFETSNSYPAIGDKISFTLQDDGCIPFEIGTISLVSQPTCANATGNVKLTIAGGSGSFLYAINGSNTYTNLPADGIIGNLGAGTYYFTIQDEDATECGEATSESITLMAGDSDLLFSVAPTNASSCGIADGALTLNITGGVAPFQYSLNGSTYTNLPAGNQLTGLTPGMYVIDVKDASNCVVSSGRVLLNAANGGLQVTVGNITNTACGSNTGSFSLTANGTALYKYQINGGLIESSAINNVVISNLAAGSHAWKMTDATGCYAEGRVLIANTGTNTLSASVTSTNAQCDGTSGGTITITVSNGTAPYSYRYDGGTDAAGWITMTGNTVTVENLPIGTYDVKVKDDTDCIYEYEDVNIIRENTTDLNVGTIQIVTQPSCSSTTGSIFVDVTGGSGSYQYILNDGPVFANLPADGIIGNLSAGTYIVSVRDAAAPVCGIAISEPITLRAGDSDLNVAVASTNAASCGVADGVLTLTITGGVAPYQYSLNGSTYANVPASNTLTGLAPGVYVVDVKDASGCITSSGQVTISATDGGLQVIAHTNIPTTCGNANGSFTLTMTTGTTPYTYQIDGGITNETTNSIVTINGLTAGNHVWKVTDATGCIAEGNEVIANNGTNTLAFTATPVNALCDGTTGGKITINVVGGTAPYSYRYNNGAWVDFTGASVTIHNLPQGVYDLEVKDNTDCIYEYQNATIGRDNSTDLQVNSINIVSHPTCGNNDGSIQISVTGGGGVYEYALNGSTSYTSLPSTGIISNLGAGTYRISVRDAESRACGVAISESVTLNSNNTAMTLGVLATNASSCGVADGVLTLTINGGTAPYQYSLNGSAYAAVPAGNQLTALTSGVYVVDVKDASGCVASSGETTISAADGGLQVVVSDNINATCGESIGGFTLTVNTGTRPYEYQINGGAMQTMTSDVAVVSNLSAGTHVWRVIDATGCYADGSESVGNNDTNAVTATVSKTNAQCGGFGGSITITVQTGTAPYEYSLDGGTTWVSISGNTVTIQNLTEGNYDIQVKDNTGCVYENQNVVIGVENTVNLAVGTIQIVTQPTCANPTGSIQLDVTGGSGSYQYAFSATDTYTALPTDGIITGLSAGTYRVYIQDELATLCGTAISESITLRAGDSDLTLIAISANASSCGATDGSISLNITGGTAPYQYSLNGSTYAAVPVGNQLTGLTSGLYVIDIKDATNCVTSSGEVQINATDGGLQVTANANTATTCGNADGRFTLTATTGTAPYQYQIDGGVIQTMNGYSVVVENLTAGSHTWSVTDATGCYAEGRETIANTGTNTLAITATATLNAQCDGTSGGEITITVTNGLAPYQYSYDGGTTWTAFTGNATTAAIQNLAQGVYNILVKDNTGCTYEYQNVVVGRDNTIDLTVGTVQIVSQPTCADATGSIQITVTGGSGNYQYAFSATDTYTALPANGIITGLSAGTYRVYVQDSEASVCGTAISEAITLKAGNSDLTLVATPANASSCGVSDGSVTLSITGGTAPYQYSLNGSTYAAVPVSNQLTGLTSGIYVIDIKDATNCVTSSGQVQINATDGGLNAVINAVTNTTCGNTAGSFTLTVNGTAPYQYQVDGGVLQTMTGNSAIISNLSAGSHVWSVTDASGCFAEGSQVITNTGSNTLAATASATSNAQCDGTSGGEITINVTNGLAPFQYSYDGGTTWTTFTGNATTATIQNLAQGVYDILVQDNTGCTFEYQNVTIGRDNTIDLAVGTIQVVSQPTCANTTGSIQITVTGGSGNYQYAFSATDTYTALPADGIITGLSAGTYRVYVQDSEAPVCGTAISEAITLKATDSDLILSAVASNASSCGVSDGSIALTITGGTSPYQYSLNGSTYAAVPTGNQLVGLTSGIYIIDIKDATNCVTSSGEVQVNTTNSGLNAVISAVTNTTCGNTAGGFTLTVNGTAPYQYQIDGGVLQTMTGNSAIISNLSAGSHVWSVTDASGCFAEGSQVITNTGSNTLTVAATATNAQCDGTSGGSITITVTNGLAPFQYSYDGGTTWTAFTGNATTATIQNLAQGVYDILVQDNTGCTYEYQNALIGRDNTIDIAVGTIQVVVQPTCGNATGSIRVQVSGGSGNYQYALNGAATYTALPADGVITGLSAGTYRVSVQDSDSPLCGTAISEAVILTTTNGDIALTATATDASSCGINDGSINLTVTGGTAPYTYTLNGTAVTPVSGVIGNLTSGAYVINVTDNAGCTVTSGEVNINATDGGLQVAVSANTSTTCGNAAGSFVLTANGTAPYQYQVNGGVLQPMTGNSATISNLTAGSHAWYVVDATGCFAVGNEVVNNSNNNNFAFTVATVNAQCDGTDGGSITINVTGGTAPFSYRYDAGTDAAGWIAFNGTSTTATIANLSEGNYTVRVKDNTGCIYEYQNTVISRDNRTDLQVASISVVTQPTCSTSTGSILLIVSGGSGNYEYILSETDTYTTLPASGIISGLAAGTYSVSVRDVAASICGVALSEAITLQATDTDMTLGVTANNASSCGVADGSLTLTITGGTAPYQYSLNGGTYAPVPADNILAGLTSGVYVIDVKDATNCVVSSGEVMIGATDGGLLVTAGANTSTTCGNANGSFTLTFAGTAPYQYQIDGGIVMNTTGNSVFVANLTAGDHVWNVTDATGCYAEGREVITNSGSNTLAFTTTSTNAGCDGTGSGTITISVTNGLAPYQYSYDNGATWTPFVGNAATATIPNLAVGSYDIQVKDNNNCTFEYQNAVIERNTNVDILIGTIQVVDQPVCGTNTGSIRVTVSGGSGTYQYALNGSATYTALPADGVISNLSAGTYVVYIQDATAPTCGTVISEAIALNPANSSLKVSVASTGSSSCGVNNGVLTLTVTGGTAPYQYSLNGGTYAGIPAGNQITGLAPGTYTVDIKDADNCVASSGQVVLSATDGGLQVTASANVSASCGNATGSFTLRATTGTAPYKYQIDGGALQTMIGNNVVISNLAAGNHSWKVTDATGCFAQGEEMIANSGSNSLLFTAVATDVQCDGTNGSIAISVTSGVAPYQYSYDNGTTWTAFTGNATTATIPNLTQGIYDVTVKDNTGCTYEYQDVTISQHNNITPPLANSPQEFCAGATVANLQATGEGIKWYDAAGNLLSAADVLVNNAVYYATQSSGTYCESETRTPVKVIIGTPVLDAPNIKASQSFCAPATLADVATNGNTNIVWYDAAVGGNQLPLTTPLVDGISYYAAQTAGGTCESDARTEMTATITAVTPEAPTVTTPQYFCDGAIVANLAVSNNQIKWYTTSTGGSALASDVLLTAGTYYAAQNAGSCESTTRTPVQVIINSFPKPEAQGTQTTCGGDVITLADLKVKGSGIVWYDALTGGNKLPLSTVLVDNTTYYAAQSSGDCESERIPVTVTSICYSVYGTVFPFVYEGDPDFDNMFPVTVKLFSIPPATALDPVDYILEDEPLHITRAFYYDGSIYVPGTPKKPGKMGVSNNPGLAIDWAGYGKTPGAIDNTTVTGVGDVPTGPVGLYYLQNIAPGDYILGIYRPGFVTRWGKVSINSNDPLGHREILAGDVDGDLEVTVHDVSKINNKESMYGSPNYNPTYDFNGDGQIKQSDNAIMMFDLNIIFDIYQETQDWIYN